MPELAEHLSGYTESVIRSMTRLAQQTNAVNLAQGFPDFDPPAALIATAHRAIDGDYHQYAITWGAKNFRQALAKKISRSTNLECEADRHLVVTCGSTEAMLASLMSICNAGDKVIVFSPFYENYGAGTILCWATPIFVHLEPPDWHFDCEELRRAFAQGIRAIVLCNPSNPTGRVFTEQELLFILQLAEEHEAFAHAPSQSQPFLANAFSCCRVIPTTDLTPTDFGEDPERPSSWTREPARRAPRQPVNRDQAS